MNTIGRIFRLTDFGESHGPAIGGVIDGVPAGYRIDLEEVQRELDRRRPGARQPGATARNESDTVSFFSGIMDGVTLGTPIGFTIPNSDAHSKDYSNLERTFRPNHADMTYQLKYGIRDHRGGGRSSARETAVRVVGGAVAKQILRTMGVAIHARILSIGTESNPERFEQYLSDLRRDGDTAGCIIECSVQGAPAGWGEPIFGKLQASLAAAMMSINAAKGFEYGDGFETARSLGSQVMDTPYYDEYHHRFGTLTNHSGGIQGGISNGEEILFRVAFKPIATRCVPVDTVDHDGQPVQLHVHGRHDVCVAFRALPVVEAMAAITILDAALTARALTPLR